MGTRLVFSFVVLCVMGAGAAQADLILMEPDDYADGTDISSIRSDVTLSVISTFLEPEVYARTESNPSASPSTGSQVFGYETGYNWSSNVADLRVDFTAPTNFVSIDAIADDSFDPVQVTIYNSGGSQLDTTTTDGSGTDTVSFSRTTWDISTMIVTNPAASPAETYMLDNLRFQVVPEPGALLLLGVGLAGLAVAGRRREATGR